MCAKFIRKCPNEILVALPLAAQEIDADTRADVRAMIDDGLLPSEISRELEIPIKAIEGMRREYLRKKKLDALAGNTNPALPPSDPASAALQAQISEMERAIQKEMLQDQYDHLKRKRSLDLEERELNLRRKRYELREDYEMDDEAQSQQLATIDHGDEPSSISGEMDLDFDFEERPLESAAKLIAVLKNKNDSGIRKGQVQQMNIPDATKPMSDEQIDGILRTLNSVQIAGLKAMSDEQIEEEIKQYLPAALPENIKRTVSRIRHYGQG